MMGRPVNHLLARLTLIFGSQEGESIPPFAMAKVQRESKETPVLDSLYLPGHRCIPWEFCPGPAPGKACCACPGEPHGSMETGRVGGLAHESRNGVACWGIPCGRSMPMVMRALQRRV